MRILLAIDGSSASDVALEAVKNRPWPPGTKVRVLSVAEPVYPPPPSPAGLMFGEPAPQTGTGVIDVNQRLFEDARALAERAAAALRNALPDAEGFVEQGDPRDVIVSQAGEWHADLIVLGSHGRKGIKRWVLGSVAEVVVRHAPCSVEVVRRREGAEA
jgi:nucleotide-binding universal stress UspA family protein